MLETGPGLLEIAALIMVYGSSLSWEPDGVPFLVCVAGGPLGVLPLSLSLSIGRKWEVRMVGASGWWRKV